MRTKSFLHAAELLDPPQPAVDQALGAIVAQTDQLVARDRQRLGDAAQGADALIVEPARPVEADQHLIRRQHHRRLDLVAADDPGLAVVAVGDLAAAAHDLRRGG